jgi:hypothetical protein
MNPHETGLRTFTTLAGLVRTSEFVATLSVVDGHD